MVDQAGSGGDLVRSHLGFLKDNLYHWGTGASSGGSFAVRKVTPSVAVSGILLGAKRSRQCESLAFD